MSRRAAHSLLLAVLEPDAQELIEFILSLGAQIREMHRPTDWPDSREPVAFQLSRDFRTMFQENCQQMFDFAFRSVSGTKPPSEIGIRERLRLILRGIFTYKDISILYMSVLAAEFRCDEMEPYWKQVEHWVKEHFLRLRPVISGGNVLYVGPAAQCWKGPDHYIYDHWESAPLPQCEGYFPSVTYNSRAQQEPRLDPSSLGWLHPLLRRISRVEEP
jgi:hypothetical protein